MARQPKLILREGAVDDIVDQWRPGSFLETGAGTGYMTRKFLEKGYHGSCYELSETARAKIRENLRDYPEQINIVDSLAELEGQQFDYLLSFEVLEHIENDLEALLQWTACLKSQGVLLISVPAHSRKYGKSDELVGHVRRYERDELQTLLQDAGYRDIHLINYGFPLSEISRPLANAIARRDNPNQGKSMQELSLHSSHSRQPHVRRIIDLVGERPVLPFRSMQRMFYRYDWGDGIIATAIKT